MNQLDMKGRSAIVTGGASGIGLAIARRLAQSGASVAIWDMNEKTMAEAAKSLGAPKTHTARVDVTKLDQVESAFPRSSPRSPPSARSMRWCAPQASPA